MKTGILLHVYNLGTAGWEDMMWGNPARDELGVLTKLAECLFDIPASDEVVTIVYSGPSEKDGQSEGTYTKRYLVDRLDELTAFQRLRNRLERLSPSDRALFIERVEGIVVGPEIKNTVAEVEMAAALFVVEQVDRVLQIAAATHAPRCLRNQLSLKHKGAVPLDQPWTVVPADVGFAGRTPDDIVIAEPIARPDNPLYSYRPSWVEITKRYPQLSLENKKTLLAEMDALTRQLLAEQPADTPVAN